MMMEFLYLQKSGETTLSSCHPLKIANEIVYELYDTPGFNNDEELLDYIEDNEANFEDFLFFN